nr:alpha-D-ribose 1-methylphosphonate 5-phosphate C-P-lyase PhnJ [Desulfobacula sp.]
MIRRAILKALAVPGFQVPFGGKEVPLPCGWGTGGIQLTASLLGKEDVLKVIDQGCDDAVNAVGIKDFFRKTAGIRITENTPEATLIQTRHRIPETPLKEGQIMVYQSPDPEPLRFIEPRRAETLKMHAYEEYGAIYVRLYEDISKHGRMVAAFDYPALVHGRYIMSPSPLPGFDNPKLHRSPAIHLFGSGREKRIYAVPPYTDVKSLDFEDYPFEPEPWEQSCALCGSTASFLDEIITDDKGSSLFVCSDTEYCRNHRQGEKP